MGEIMPNGKPRILVVNDNQKDREYLTLILQSLDCLTDTAENGANAIQKIREFIPDLILLDSNMPLVSGYQTAQTIRQQSRNGLIPILFLTENMNGNGHAANVSDLEAVDVLRKPYQPFEVISRCKSLLNLSQFEYELEMAEQVLKSLALAVEARDPTTGNHCDRLYYRLTRLADMLALGHDMKDTLLKGSILHDIGKVGVPDSVLLKEGPLTDKEWMVMKQHVIIGESLCRPLKFLHPVLPLIRHHHERFDGSGYPDSLKGEEIPLVARVFQVCDVFDALTSKRPYKRSFTEDESKKILETEMSKGWWDPRIVEAFFKMLSVEPKI
ncbi:MAG: two-component system response regulator [Candidatus Omnitrophica bacterium CG11_big_fil_rev_8_21_14_0_20_45_26]|uniref:Two-component system response regulator n=1 Tax=Candidatus Abzuiibacterium crystallinum TaxID=1974748 RepID=A0A2H0LLT1_9BACT|nr:MAG: two-component system response regulator [Candidatus Omnitrophica bacterium CG11_big_fil_rev_8_21_14_0_20_45_26]PIW63219.1 MAG: two-component system response regulator [Candidatus Omnitrophica bacterium CG12_big_fil_rev_8_21_14_0_65_45_16]